MSTPSPNEIVRCEWPECNEPVPEDRVAELVLLCDEHAEPEPDTYGEDPLGGSWS